MESLGRQAVGEFQRVVAALGLVGVEAELPGVVLGAEEPGVLARPGERPLDQAERQCHAARDAVAPAAEAVDDGRVAREVVARGDAVEVGGATRRRLLAGERPVDGGEVVPLAVGHRADDGELPGPLCQAGQVLAEADAGGGGADWLELAADPLGGVGLQVERVVLADSAAEQDNDHRLRPARAGDRGRGCRAGGPGAGGEEAREAHPQETRVAHLEEPATVERGRPFASNRIGTTHDAGPREGPGRNGPG